MTPSEARAQFAQLGGSWKRSTDRSRNKSRTLGTASGGNAADARRQPVSRTKSPSGARPATWGQLIENARHRLKFVRDQLGYVATEESALEYLRRAHSLIVLDSPIGSDGERDGDTPLETAEKFESGEGLTAEAPLSDLR